MNLPLLARLLGIVALLIGGVMAFSLPWAFPALGYRHSLDTGPPLGFERGGFFALLASIGICGLVGGILLFLGRNTKGRLYRKEAMAVVGLSWMMATVLGALPFWLSNTGKGSSLRYIGEQQILTYKEDGLFAHWQPQEGISQAERIVLRQISDAGSRGLTPATLQQNVDRQLEQEKLPNNIPSIDVLKTLTDLFKRKPDWKETIYIPPDDLQEVADRNERYSNIRVRWVSMNFVDALFESQSGFSTTGATVISELEDPYLVPHSILFWRSSTHFLGGLGIIVLFVAILGQGSAGKALMRSEMPGPTKEGSAERMQHTAWVFAALYCGLNLFLIIFLWGLGMSVFDAFCHGFGTMATGGYSTYNDSLGHFVKSGHPYGEAIEYVVILFMILAGTNFTLLYFVLLKNPAALLKDFEWRTYVAIIFGITTLVFFFGLFYGDFESERTTTTGLLLSDAFRNSLFQVASILTTTGFGTSDFDQWNSFGRGVLFLLMFIGGCAGSTGGGMKVIRHILFIKILRLEMEQSYHPTVIRPLRLNGGAIESEELRKNILVYFGLILVIFIYSWMAVITLEPDTTWGTSMEQEHKLIDSASGVAATLNNIGPGLGTVGATQNYGHFSSFSKLLFTLLMMIGRVEVFVILVLFMPSFWKNH
ncbi:MAG: TrkH family potassium uptake protein [Pirellulaceae bacterium]|nr:TrkH family potassium uptake protein [Pirellulaceae bacterium]